MNYLAYLRSHLVEFLLCAVMAAGLGLNAVQAFHIPQETATNVALVVAATALPLAALFLVGFNRRSQLFGGLGICVALVVYAVVLGQITPTTLFAETYENSALVFVVLLPVALSVYLLARTRIGIVVVFVAGCIACGAVQFLYAMDLVAPTAAFVAASGALYLMKSSREPLAPHEAHIGVEGDASPQTAQLESASANTRPASRIPRIAMAFALPLAAALAALAVFVFAIAPLNPPAHELKLITEYYSLEEVHVSGILGFMHQRDESTSQNLDDDTQSTNAVGDEEQDAEGGSDSQQDGEDERLGKGSYDATTVGNPLSMIRYLQEHWWWGLIVLACIAIAWIATVIARRALRGKRLSRWRALGPRREYVVAYDHVCSTLERARLIDRNSKTPRELAASAEDTLSALEAKAPLPHEGSSAQFSQLSECFIRVSYGDEQPAPEELQAIESYVEVLPKRLMKTVGPVRYLRHFFRV